MKRVVKSFFIFLLLFAVVNVSALNVGDKFSISYRQTATVHSSKYEMGGEKYELESATGGGKTYDAYCIDRGLEPIGERSVYRMLNEFKGDYAALYIMKNGADDEEIHLAIRALVSEGIWNYGYKSASAATYLALLNAKVNCMKSDPEFSSVLTEFLSTSSKKNEDSDEGGKSIALLGFDKYNLLEGKCYSTAAQCSKENGDVQCKKKNENCYIPTESKCPKCHAIEAAGRFCTDDYRDANGCMTEYLCDEEHGDLSKNSCDTVIINRNMDDRLYPGYWICEKISGIGCYRPVTTSNCSALNETERDRCCYRNGYFTEKSDCDEENNSDSKKCVFSNGCYRIVDKSPNQYCDGSKGEYDINTCLKRKKDNQDCQELDNGCYKLVNISAKCDESKGEYTKDQCEGVKKTKKIKEKIDGSCVIQSNGCYKFVADSSGNGSGGSGSGSGGSSGASTSCG